MYTTYIRTEEEAEAAATAAAEVNIDSTAADFLHCYLMNVRQWQVWGEMSELEHINEAVLAYREEQDEAGMIWSDEDDCYYDPSDPDTWPESVKDWHEAEFLRANPDPEEETED